MDIAVVDVYKTLFEIMGDSWEWAYAKQPEAVAYFDGAWCMAERILKKMGIPEEDIKFQNSYLSAISLPDEEVST